MKKMIVTVAPTSNFHGKEANPALPFSPQEVAESVYETWNEGASIVHIHGRDEKGLPTHDPAFFQEADRLIREKKCDIIIQHSMAPANPVLLGKKEGDIDEGTRTTTTEPPPEMASLEVAPSNIIADGKVYNMLWDRLCVGTQRDPGNSQQRDPGLRTDRTLLLSEARGASRQPHRMAAGGTSDNPNQQKRLRTKTRRAASQQVSRPEICR